MKNLPSQKFFPYSNLHLQQASSYEFLVWVSYLLLPWKDTKNICFKQKYNLPSNDSYLSCHRIVKLSSYFVSVTFPYITAYISGTQSFGWPLSLTFI